MILTTYFCEHRHPQWMDPNTIGIDSCGYVNTDDFEYMKEWYISVCKAEEKSLIFHDSLSAEFVDKYTNDYVSFCEVHSLGVLSNNDWRFFVYDEYLRQSDLKETDSVFMTDIADVKVVQIPELNADSLYFCLDNGKVLDYNFNGVRFPDIVKNNTLGSLDVFYSGNFPLLNMGVIGGKLNIVKEFLEQFVFKRQEALNYSFNMNMSLGNFIARTNFNVVAGYPFCSEYKKYENRDDVGFIHK